MESIITLEKTGLIVKSNITTTIDANR